MTRRDFEALADIMFVARQAVRTLPPKYAALAEVMVDDTCHSIAAWCSYRNRHFDRDRFMRTARGDE